MTGRGEERWYGLLSGYRLPYDPRPAIAKLNQDAVDAAWAELWRELHHQGDVDTASYAAVPELVMVCALHASRDWNVYALVGAIELRRAEGENPNVPDWLAPRYRDALARLAELAVNDLKRTDDPLVVRSALGIIAITKGLRAYARILLELDESEVEAIVDGETGGA